MRTQLTFLGPEQNFTSNQTIVYASVHMISDLEPWRGRVQSLQDCMRINTRPGVSIKSLDANVQPADTHPLASTLLVRHKYPDLQSRISRAEERGITQQAHGGRNHDRDEPLPPLPRTRHHPTPTMLHVAPVSSRAQARTHFGMSRLLS
jgi:hypothetical protein